jgi:hypothetical protein
VGGPDANPPPPVLKLDMPLLSVSRTCTAEVLALPNTDALSETCKKTERMQCEITVKLMA